MRKVRRLERGLGGASSSESLLLTPNEWDRTNTRNKQYSGYRQRRQCADRMNGKREAAVAATAAAARGCPSNDQQPRTGLLMSHPYPVVYYRDT